MHGPLGHPGDYHRNDQHDGGQDEGPGQGAGDVLDGAGQPGHEEAQTPPQEYQAIVHAQVLGAEEVGSVSRHQRQAAAVLPVSDTYEQKQHEDVAAGDNGG